jgi:hypothetical protein
MTQWMHGIHLSESPTWDPTVGALFGDRPGWVLFLAALGHDPTNGTGVDYTPWSGRGYQVSCRLQHGWGTSGCIPVPALYDDYTRRIINFISASSGCHVWQLGNEMNVEAERPVGQVILPTQYASLYDKVKTALLALPGHEGDKLLIGAVGPWNNKTIYVGNETGNWVFYLRDIIKALKTRADGVTIHAYTHGSALSLFEPQPMGAPFQAYDYNFMSFCDWFQVIDESWADRLFIITETDQNNTWLNQDNGWLQKAYQVVDNWNQVSPFKIAGVLPYRWKDDQWEFASKTGVHDMIRSVVATGYQVESEDPAMTKITDGFENGFAPFGGVGELTVPTGWTPVWVQGTQAGILVRPEFKPAGTPQIRTGLGAVAIHSAFATIDGAIYRQFEVPRGSAVAIKTWMMKEATEGGSACQIGIDPTGGIQHTSAAIVWSEWYSQYATDWSAGGWRERVAAATAASNVITVFLRSKADVAVEGTHAHFDDFSIEYEAGVIPPTPGPGQDHLVQLVVDGVVVYEETFSSGLPADKVALVSAARQSLGTAVDNLDQALGS